MALLSRYQNKRIRVTTESGEMFAGVADVCPAGYGLHEFGRAEESLQLGDVQIFQSDIRKIEELPDRVPEKDPRRFDDLMGDLLEGPYRIVDILPGQVPAEADGQYFAVERYFLQPERLRPLRRSFAGILLRLNCWFDMTVSFDSCESWEENPDPEAFAARLDGLSGNVFLRAMFEKQGAMIDIEPDETWMTVYDPEDLLQDKLQKLAEAEGLFVWSPPETFQN